MKAILKWQAASVLPREVVANEEARARGTKHQNDAGLEKGPRLLTKKNGHSTNKHVFSPHFQTLKIIIEIRQKIHDKSSTFY